MVNAAAFELQFACKIPCSQLHCDFERRNSDEFLRGVCSNVNIDDLHLFFNCCFGILKAMSFSFQLSIFKQIQTVSVRKQLAGKKGITLIIYRNKTMKKCQRVCMTVCTHGCRKLYHYTFYITVLRV